VLLNTRVVLLSNPKDLSVIRRECGQTLGRVRVRTVVNY